MADKEVADSLGKSFWTVKTQKKVLYRKIGVSKDTELVLFMVCERLNIEFNLTTLRTYGLAMLPDMGAAGKE